MTKEPIILAIESSCDDTSAAILKAKKSTFKRYCQPNYSQRIWWCSS